MAGIEMFPVQSSRIESIGYEESTKTLRVGFRNGSLFAYEDVSPFEFRQLRNWSPIEDYLERHIKDKHKNHRVC